MAPSFQDQEPPENPVRFRPDNAPSDADERGIPAFVSIHHRADSAGANGEPNSQHRSVGSWTRMGGCVG